MHRLTRPPRKCGHVHVVTKAKSGRKASYPEAYKR